MSSLLARILLAIFMLPLAAVVYFVTIVAFIEATNWNQQEAGFILAGAATWVFLAVFWCLLWLRTVRWAPWRIGWTVAAAAAAAALGAVLGLLMAAVEEELGAFIGSVTTPILWLAFTVFVWRETGGERIARVRAAGGTAIACPRCGYNMTGLRATSCPECGAHYTLDELLALQPARDAGPM